MADSSNGLSAMVGGTSSLQENAPTSTPGPTLTPGQITPSEDPGVTPMETPTPTSTATANPEPTLIGSDLTRTGMEISPDQEELQAARKERMRVQAEQTEPQKMD